VMRQDVEPIDLILSGTGVMEGNPLFAYFRLVLPAVPSKCQQRAFLGQLVQEGVPKGVLCAT
jgi:hypothetical protein